MFKKPPTLGTSTSLKNSDRRNLIKELCERYSNITIEKCKSTIFSEGLKQCKATTSNGDYLTLFTSSNGLPLAFRIGKGEQGALIPTVYSIWKSSISIPTLVTNDMVLSKLVEGADLFAPGLSRHSLATLPDDLPEGTIVAIGTTSVTNAIRGIGRLATHSKNLKESSQGKAVEVLHVEGDSLWALGDKGTAQPKETSQPSNAETTGLSDGNEASAVGATGPDDNTRSPDETLSSTPQAELSIADVDSMLKEAAIYAISQIFSKQSNPFPISSSKFMDTYVLPSRRASVAVAAGHEVSIKKSSFKNASAFLKFLKKEGLIVTKEAKGGEITVISVETSHPEVKAFKAYKTVGEAQKQEKKREIREEKEHGKAAQRTVEVTELFKPHGGAMALCETLGFGKDDLALPTDLRNALQDYIVDQSLINENDHSYITLDEALSSALLKKGENLDFMPRSEVNRRFIDNLQAWHRVVISEGGKREEIVGKGAPKKIGIAVKKRQGKKLVTIIDGLETFHVPHQKLAEDLQLKCASSATFGEVQGTSPKKPLYEVVVQGTQTSAVVKELTEVCGVPKAWISIAK